MKAEGQGQSGNADISLSKNWTGNNMPGDDRLDEVPEPVEMREAPYREEQEQRGRTMSTTVRR